MRGVEFNARGDIIYPEFQSIEDVVEIIHSARPWTRAAYLEEIRGYVNAGIVGALPHLLAVEREIGKLGQGLELDEQMEDEK